MIGQVETTFDRLRAFIDRRSSFALLKMKFRKHVGYDLNLEAPETRNEKMQWRKLYDRNPKFVIASDKFEVRDYLTKLLGEHFDQFLPELYQVVVKSDDIDFDALPERFVTKPTHGSGWVKIVNSKSQTSCKDIAKDCDKWLGRRFGFRNHEWAYTQIKPRVIFEEFLQKGDGSAADDIKVHVFSGEPRYLQLDIDRFSNHHKLILSPEWMTYFKEDPSELLPKPDYLDEILKASEIIGREYDYIRVDFLVDETRWAINELTVYSGSGMNGDFLGDVYDYYKSKEFDQHLGGLWTLPKLR